MRSYDEYCAVAKSLDVVGDRWTLLIVRELELRGACRYTDLRSGLPGIATNLLAERLRELERAGVITREDAPPPIATALFQLTPWGAQPRPVLEGLIRWGLPLLTGPPRPILAVLHGRYDLDEAETHGVTCDGDPALLDRIVAHDTIATPR